MRNLVPQEGGRFLNELDVHDLRRVAFLGDRLATNLFGEHTSPVGKVLSVNQSPFLIVGVLVKKDQDSSYGGPDRDKMFIPSTTFRALTGQKYINNFVFQAGTAGDTKKGTERLSAAFGKRLLFDPKDKEALRMWDTNEQFVFFDVFMLAFNGFLGIVGVLTLIVGGIGVSNIMN